MSASREVTATLTVLRLKASLHSSISRKIKIKMAFNGLNALLLFGICSIAGLALMVLPGEVKESLEVRPAHFIPSAFKKRTGEQTGERSQLLVDEDEHVYTLKRSNIKSKVWRCVRHHDRRCKVEVHTNLEVS